MGDVVTIRDVARRANVSVATVSRALNGHEHVADAVRRRILSIADELRYSPHHAARSLSSRVTSRMTT
jgi:LacI family transcriptional regulator